jgi:hypothetical protein
MKRGSHRDTESQRRDRRSMPRRVVTGRESRHPEGSGSDPRDLGSTNGSHEPEIPRVATAPFGMTPLAATVTRSFSSPRRGESGRARLCASVSLCLPPCLSLRPGCGRALA